MKFFIILSIVILISAHFCVVSTKRNSSKSKKNKSKVPPKQPIVSTPVQSKPASFSSSNVASSASSTSTASSTISRPVVNIQRPYVNSAPKYNYVNQVKTFVSSPTLYSGTPKGPRGIYYGNYFARPLYQIRRYAVIRVRLNECPQLFRGESLVKEVSSYCPNVCNRQSCIQTRYVCCIYTNIDDIETDDTEISLERRRK